MARLGEPIEGPACWRGDELLSRPDWLVPLRSADQDLEAVQHGLEHGSGATLLRGFQIGERSEEELTAAFQAIAGRIGTAVSQSPRGGASAPRAGTRASVTTIHGAVGPTPTRG